MLRQATVPEYCRLFAGKSEVMNPEDEDEKDEEEEEEVEEETTRQQAMDHSWEPYQNRSGYSKRKQKQQRPRDLKQNQQRPRDHSSNDGWQTLVAENSKKQKMKCKNFKLRQHSESRSRHESSSRGDLAKKRHHSSHQVGEGGRREKDSSQHSRKHHRSSESTKELHHRNHRSSTSTRCGEAPRIDDSQRHQDTHQRVQRRHSESRSRYESSSRGDLAKKRHHSNHQVGEGGRREKDSSQHSRKHQRSSESSKELHHRNHRSSTSTRCGEAPRIDDSQRHQDTPQRVQVSSNDTSSGQAEEPDASAELETKQKEPLTDLTEVPPDVPVESLMKFRDEPLTDASSDSDPEVTPDESCHLKDCQPSPRDNSLEPRPQSLEVRSTDDIIGNAIVKTISEVASKETRDQIVEVSEVTEMNNRVGETMPSSSVSFSENFTLGNNAIIQEPRSDCLENGMVPHLHREFLTSATSSQNQQFLTSTDTTSHDDISVGSITSEIVTYTSEDPRSNYSLTSTLPNIRDLRHEAQRHNNSTTSFNAPLICNNATSVPHIVQEERMPLDETSWAVNARAVDLSVFHDFNQQQAQQQAGTSEQCFPENLSHQQNAANNNAERIYDHTRGPPPLMTSPRRVPQATTVQPNYGEGRSVNTSEAHQSSQPRMNSTILENRQESRGGPANIWNLAGFQWYHQPPPASAVVDSTALGGLTTFPNSTGFNHPPPAPALALRTPQGAISYHGLRLDHTPVAARGDAPYAGPHCNQQASSSAYRAPNNAQAAHQAAASFVQGPGHLSGPPYPIATMGPEIPMLLLHPSGMAFPISSVMFNLLHTPRGAQFLQGFLETTELLYVNGLELHYSVNELEPTHYQGIP